MTCARDPRARVAPASPRRLLRAAFDATSHPTLGFAEREMSAKPCPRGALASVTLACWQPLPVESRLPLGLPMPAACSDPQSTLMGTSRRDISTCIISLKACISQLRPPPLSTDGWLRQQRCGGRKSEIEGSAGLGSPEAPLLGLQTAVFSLVPAWPSLRASEPSSPLLTRTPVIWSRARPSDLILPYSPPERLLLQTQSHSEVLGLGIGGGGRSSTSRPLTFGLCCQRHL